MNKALEHIYTQKEINKINNSYATIDVYDESGARIVKDSKIIKK